MNLDSCLRIKHAWSLRRFKGRNRSAFASLLRDGEDPIPGNGKDQFYVSRCALSLKARIGVCD